MKRRVNTQTVYESPNRYQYLSPNSHTPQGVHYRLQDREDRRNRKEQKFACPVLKQVKYDRCFADFPTFFNDLDIFLFSKGLPRLNQTINCMVIKKHIVFQTHLCTAAGNVGPMGLP
jgi:hypothetical protein